MSAFANGKARAWTPDPLKLNRQGGFPGAELIVRQSNRRMAHTPVHIAIERIAGRLHRARRIAPGPPPVKVKLGSGMFVARGWIKPRRESEGIAEGLDCLCPARDLSFAGQ
jgi:hypothetical protein